MANTIKARYWTSVLYPESMIEEWEDKIESIVQFPCAYCIHDKDVDSLSNTRKTHIHLVICYPNTTTENSVLSILQKLQPSCKYVETVQNIRYMYNYLIHDTPTCRKQGKFLYEESERVLLNNFDIGNYEQISRAEKKTQKAELRSLILNNKISNYVDFEISADSLDGDYSTVIEENSAYFERLCRGNWYKYVYQK